MINLVLDDGSNFIKIAYRNKDNSITTHAFASRVIRKAVPSTTLTGLSAASYEIDGDRYTVSKTAVDTIPTDNRTYQTSFHNRVLIQHGIRYVLDQLGTDEEFVNVMVTLPVGQFFNPDGTKNEQLIEKKIQNVKGHVKNLGGNKTVKIESCYVMPEGVPAFTHVKNELRLTGSRYLLADIGGTTTDLVVINDQDQIEQFQSLNLGALKMLSKFSTLVSEKLNLSGLTDELAVNGLLSGMVAGDDVSDIVTMVLKDFQSTVNDEIARLGELRLFDAVIYSGGGANLLSSTYVDVLKSKEPQFDNALGALAIMDTIE
ncbi:recombinase [Shewanella sairae]|uniref:Recombinase n=1 Tax=Shewanella sairae TaxID=190310 RepID=A0ABQ4P5R4_9GAMM|nr:ParM/StbA family protein [Shewanella sairae]MCL1130459.1 ParM/StbA family protein [Shewanella sairae]GIU42815.1 recombinase [Shewanella sairae]